MSAWAARFYAAAGGLSSDSAARPVTMRDALGIEAGIGYNARVMNQDALLIGFDDSIKLSIHLDYKDNQKIYIKLGTLSVIERKDFDRILNFLRLTKPKVKAAEKGEAQLLSPKSMAAEGHVYMLENGVLKITVGNFVKNLSKDAYLVFLEELENAKNNLIRFDKIQELTPEARAAMGVDEAGRPTRVKDAIYTARIVGYSLAVIIFILNTVLFVAAIFNPIFLYLVAAVYLILVDAYLLLPASEKKAIAVFRMNAKDYVNEDMFKNLDSLPISRKGMEFFVILGMGMVFFTAYFTKALPSIMSTGKKLFGGESENALGMDDITKFAGGLTIKSKDNYDVKKKFYNFNDVLETLFKVAVKNRVTFTQMKIDSEMAGGFYKISFDGELLVSTPQDFQTFRNTLVFEKPFKTCEGSKGADKYNFKITADVNMTSEKYFRAMKYITSSPKKVEKMIQRVCQIFTGKDTKLDMGFSTRKKELTVIQVGVTGTTEQIQQITGFIKSIETDPVVLQCLLAELEYLGGKYRYKFIVTAVFK